MPNMDLQRMSDAVEQIRGQIADAAKQSGRRAEDVLLCAVCKTQPSDIVLASAGLPIDLFGENRMQELVIHQQEGAFGGKPCHFIGHLQTNKVRRVVGQVEMIQSVNSSRLLEAISREARRQDIVQDILLEVNIGEEATKTGASEEEVFPLIDLALASEGIRLRGLMAIPPAFDNSDQSRGYFAAMRRLLESARKHAGGDAVLDTLSMGMTDSYIAAILEGSTLVRIGRAIYGERQ